MCKSDNCTLNYLMSEIEEELYEESAPSTISVSIPKMENRFQNRDVEFTPRYHDRKLEIIAQIHELKARYNFLQETRQKQLQNLVSNNELLQIKSQISYSLLNKQSIDLTDLIYALVEEERECRTLIEKQITLERQISNEISVREHFTSNLKIIDDAVDLSNIPIDPIKLKDVPINSLESLPLQISLLQAKYESLKVDLDNLDNEYDAKKPTSQILNDISKFYNAQWRIEVLGLKDVNNDIKLMKQQISDTQNYISKIEESNSKDRKKVISNKESYQSSYNSLVQQINNNMKYFNEQIAILDSEKQKLESDIYTLSNSTKVLSQEIEDLNSQLIEKVKLHNVMDELTPVENNSSSNANDFNPYSVLETSLQSHKKQLLKQIDELNIGYMQTRTNYKISISHKKHQVQKLNEKYKNVKQELSKYRVEIHKENSDEINNLQETVNKNLNDLLSLASIDGLENTQ